jgi:tetratricopeptide (TPR) repeat protein
LVNAADGYHLWSETYDRELDDVFAIQDEISRSIARTLELKLAVAEGEPLAPVHTTDMEAYDLYLKGRHYWYKRYEVGLQTSLEYFQKACAKDPNFALPYAGIADAFSALGWYGFMPPDQAAAKALPAAERALALDDTLADAHFAMARAVSLKGDVRGFQLGLVRAIELNPSLAEAQSTLAFALGERGQLEDALRLLERAKASDPESTFVAIQSAWTRLSAARYEEALLELEWVLEREPEAANGLFLLGEVLGALSRHDEAISTHQKVATITNRAPTFLGFLGSAYARAGLEDEALAVFEELKERSSREYVTPVSLAMLAGNLGRADEAFAYLQGAVEEGNSTAVMFMALPSFDAIRSDARFGALREAVVGQLDV